MTQSVSSGLGAIQSTASDIAASLPERDLFAVFGAIALAGLTLFILYAIIRAIIVMSRRLNQVSSERAMKNDATPGNKVMLVQFGGTSGNATRRAVTDALERFLPEFNFGSPFYMGYSAHHIETTEFALTLRDFTSLERLFAASGADVVIWGNADRKGKGQRLCFSTRDMLSGSNPKGFFTVTITGDPSRWGEDELRAIAYVAGRRLRPALGRPGDFRAERLSPIISSMEKILDSGSVLSGQARREIENDYAAGALHIGEQLGDGEWLDKSVDCLTSTLNDVKVEDDPMRWARTKIDLGRAMTYQCEQKFEPMKLQEAMAHIRDGIDATKSDQRITYAETGFEALQRAEKLLANRRRFSIRWNV